MISNFQRSPIKLNLKKHLQTNKKSSILTKNIKTKSQINIRNQHDINKLANDLQSLKQKVEISKDILALIYCKVKKKQSDYENKISQKDLSLIRAKKIAGQYKNLYEDGLKMVVKCIDRNQINAKAQRHFNQQKHTDLKQNILFKIKEKKLKEKIQSNQCHNQNEKDQKSLDKNFQIFEEKISKKTVSIPTKNMSKSYSTVNTKKTKINFSPIQAHSIEKQGKKQKQKQNSKSKSKQKYKQSQLDHKKSNNLEIKQLNKQKEGKEPRKSKLLEVQQTKEQQSNKIKSLYENYKQRIIKRQRERNSQKMGWILQKLQENLQQLKIIRKKSQLRLSKYSPQLKTNQNQSTKKVSNIQSFDQKTRQQREKKQKIKRQKSKQKYLEIQKNKLKKINQNLF